jgi:hypothetical protein
MKTDRVAAVARSSVFAAALLAAGAGVAAAQTAGGEAGAGVAVFAPHRATTGFAPVLFAEHSGSRTPAEAFAIEAAGGVVGSLVGFGLVYLVDDDDCSVEDLGCHLENAFLGIALATVGAAAGTYLAGRAADSRPSLPGAALGAIAGAAAGIGTWHFFTEELDLVNNTEAAVVVYALTQGIVTALGSRLARALQ